MEDLHEFEKSCLLRIKILLFEHGLWVSSITFQIKSKAVELDIVICQLRYDIFFENVVVVSKGDFRSSRLLTTLIRTLYLVRAAAGIELDTSDIKLDFFRILVVLDLVK